MRCPKCQFDHELQTAECLKCGIVFARYQAALDSAAKQALAAFSSVVPSLVLDLAIPSEGVSSGS